MSREFVVNGVVHQTSLPPESGLLGLLREEMGLTGTKLGCGQGECGACTVLVGRRAVRSCVTPLAEAAGRPVTTVEGLAEDGVLHPVQRAFLELSAFQCGFCTPGALMTVAALLAGDDDPDDARIEAELAGNVCRCGTYLRIREAVRRAAALLREAADGDVDADQKPLTPAPVDTARVEPGAPPGLPWDLAEPDARDFFAVLGDGLVAVLPLPEPGALDEAEARWRPNRSAWVHVGADEVVTAFTGKVEGGQGTRTALTLLVAEELRVPPATVRVVMGDTDVSPFDLGTFGSRSMPEAAQCLRAAAATARQSLRKEIGAPDDDTATGAAAPGGRWGPLLAGVRRVETVTDRPPVIPAQRWSTAGRPSGNLAGVDVVTGAKRFPADLTRPGMLHGRVLRPPAYGATPRAVDVTRAAARDGVTAVHEDGFVGVVAPSPERAAEALAELVVEWAPAPPVIADSTPAGLAAHLRAHPVDGAGLSGAVTHESGDPDAALARATWALAATYTVPYIAHVPMEPRAALAEWSADGRLTVWLGTQRPFGTREALAAAFGLDPDRVRVVVPDFGGGFGGKHSPEVAIEAARLARAAGAPVKVQWSRAEEFTWGYFRPAAVIDVAAGADADGTLTAWEFTNVNSGAAGIMTPYRVPDQRIRYQPAASPLPQGSYRALAATANTFARESHLDELARRAGVDPLEMRLRHLDDERLRAVLRAAAERAGWDEPRPEGTGLGIACGVEKGGRLATCARVRVDAAGRLAVLGVVVAFECGAIVNPDNLTNQVEGATVMGLGGALFEAVRFDDGVILNASLRDYRVPRLSDVPPIEVVLIDRPDLPSAGGGETPIIGIAPAVANAIRDAAGVRLHDLPLAPSGSVARPS